MTDYRERGQAPRRVSWGLIGGTKVETEAGWRRVEDLRPGTLVHTFDGGLRPVRAIYQTEYGAGLAEAYPEGLILVPAGALGNNEAFYLLPDQHVMVRGTAVEGVTGESGVLVAGRHTIGYGGIGLVMPVDEINIYSLSFDEEEICYVNQAVLMHCPRPKKVAEGVSDSFSVAGPETANYLMSCRFFETAAEATTEEPTTSEPA
ncbi:MAG: Hint domain-containing protein [Pseudomonadota bacterium]